MNDRFKFQFDLYQRRFKQPLRTSHGLWQIREGIIVSLIDEGGNVARGEIAPLPWFGSETLSEALEFCLARGKTITLQEIGKIGDRFPCCQFALESALLNLKTSYKKENTDLNYCYLLPAGEKALTAWQEIYQTKNNNTFKWKIGVYSTEQEIKILEQLVQALPAGVKLRLDANGGYDLDRAKQLLRVSDRLEAIEFIEQLLPPNQLDLMMELSKKHSTPLALDESVASLKQLRSIYQQGWQGIFVIKAAIMGFPTLLLQYCQANSLDVVFSSVFETEVGRSAVLNLARRLDHPRAVGFGLDYFDRT